MRRTALVTGGNRGIGFAICEGLAAAGLDVILTARNEETGAEAASKLGCRYVKLDVAEHETIGAVVQSLGAIDVLVNNAGVLFNNPMLANRDDYHACMRVMVDGPYELIRAVVPGMRERNYGRIVNVSSDWGSFSQGLNGPGAYGVAKAALNALTLALSREVPDSIKINAMCPGWVRTRMGGENAERTPQEGADTAIWLAELPEDGPSGGLFRDRQALTW